mmetsp:Transcript_22063/g.19630  ORF Transcript_22063/g.19630 Transcript_22063/m.19630 type:complete len:181 (+) Transcript_22063:609-1151(+)
MQLKKHLNKNKIDQDNSVEFFPEDFEKKENIYTGVDIPKCRYFDPKMDAPIIENDPDHLSLDGASDPFPLNPQEIAEKEGKDNELEEISKKMKAMRVKVEDIPNMSYSRIDIDMNESVRNFQDEYENFEDNINITKDSNEYAIKSLIKRTSISINNMTKENSEYFELKHRANDMERSLDS